MIDKEMTIEEILTRFAGKSQKLAQEMSSFGLHCVGCGAATYETLEAGVLGHGMSEEDLQDLLVRLNRVLEEKPADPETITVTKRAAERIAEILAAEEKAAKALRFGDKPGGCGGYEYVLEFSKGKGAGDESFVSEGIEIHVKKEALSRLLGCEIDFVDALSGGGFKVSNPNVRGACSCGSSQSY